MFYTIYKITNIINNKIYIGKHQTLDLDDNYFGSGKALKEAIKKYGKDSFVKNILFVFDNEKDMNLKEKELITEEFVLRQDTYNMGIGGEGGPHFKNKTHSEATKQIIKEKRKLQTITEQTKLKISNNNKLTNKTRGEKVSLALKGRPKSEETKRKIRETLLNRRAVVK